MNKVNEETQKKFWKALINSDEPGENYMHGLTGEKGLQGTYVNNLSNLKKNKSLGYTAFSNLIEELRRLKKITPKQYYELKINPQERKVDPQQIESFDELWEKIVIESEKKLENEFYISKKVILKSNDNKKDKLFFEPINHRSLNIEIDKKIEGPLFIPVNEKSLKRTISGEIAVIADCIGRQHKTDNITFESRQHYVQLISEARQCFKNLKKNIKISIDVFNILTDIKYVYNYIPEKKFEFVTCKPSIRNFNFLMFGDVQPPNVVIPEDVTNESAIFDNCNDQINNYLNR